MGYSVHHKNVRAFTAEEWQLLRNIFGAILRVLPEDVAIVNQCGQAGTRPTCDAEKIAFNGAGVDAYEDFVLYRSPELQIAAYNGMDMEIWTKTNHRPYDVVVKAVLLAADGVAADAILIGSDYGQGGMTSDFNEAYDLLNRALAELIEE